MGFDLPSLITPRDDLGCLTTPFTHEEIDDIVKQMPNDKALGPDGFNGQFLKTCWHIIKGDVYALCDEFYAGNLNIESINTGFITLIPKVGSPDTVND